MALQELSPRKPLMAHRVVPEVEALIAELALDLPAYGQVRIANALRKRGPAISPADVRGVCQRSELEPTKTRLKAPEADVAHASGSDHRRAARRPVQAIRSCFSGHFRPSAPRPA